MNRDTETRVTYSKKHNMSKMLLNINDENLVSAHICEKFDGGLMDKIQSYYVKILDLPIKIYDYIFSAFDSTKKVYFVLKGVL